MGSVIGGRYELVRRIGEGGMGAIFEARQTTIGTVLAVKLLTVENADERGFTSRFLREAKGASKVRHENVIDIIDFGKTESGHAYYVMEFLEGEDLQDLLDREERIPWSRAKHLVIQVLDALHAAHEKGLVHRDMKPANCYRITRAGDQDYIKLIDFGIAKDVSADVSTMTDTGVVMGTPHYMAPEQATAQPVDARTDVYAMGVILFHLLTGSRPFNADSVVAVLTKHLTEKRPSPRDRCPEAGISPELERTLLKAMAKEPDDRWQTAAEFRDALMAIEALDTTSAVPLPAKSSSSPRWLLPAALGVAAVGIVAWIGLSGPDVRETERADAAAVEPTDNQAAPSPSEPAEPAEQPTVALPPAAPPPDEASADESPAAKPADPPPEPAPNEEEAEPEPEPASAAGTEKKRLANRKESAIEKAIKDVSTAPCDAKRKDKDGRVKLAVSGTLKESGRPSKVTATNSFHKAFAQCMQTQFDKKLRAGKGRGGQTFSKKIWF